MPFAMNFVSVRLDKASGTLTVHGVSDAADDPGGLAAVEEIQIVVHGDDDQQAPVHGRVQQPGLESWSVSLSAPPELQRGAVVYAVGVALPVTASFVWFNRFVVADIADRPGLPPT